MSDPTVDGKVIVDLSDTVSVAQVVSLAPYPRTVSVVPLTSHFMYFAMAPEVVWPLVNVYSGWQSSIGL